MAANKRTNLKHLLDVSFKVHANYGTAQMTLADILELQTRGLVELDRAPDGFVDLYIDDQKIARGEVLALNNRYAVRITEIVEQRRERPQFSVPPRSPVVGSEEPPRSRIEDLISLDGFEEEEPPSSARVLDNSIADAYEFPSIEELEAAKGRRQDDPTTGPVDHSSDTYSPRRSVPNTARQTEDRTEE